MADIFKGKKELIKRILKMFGEDCKLFPEACDIEELMISVEE